jgi:hypothetical protein
MPLLTLIYLASSLDKSNLGNAKSLGMQGIMAMLNRSITDYQQRHDERHRQRSYGRDVRLAQLALLRELCSVQSVLPEVTRDQTELTRYYSGTLCVVG